MKWRTRLSEIGPHTVKELEAKLRQGDQAAVREFLRQVSRSEIPDRLILNFSQLARRVDLPKKGLILLRDRVLDLPAPQKPDPREQAEYAACLLKLGALGEARRLLSEVPKQNNPEAVKYLAFTFVHQWNYAEALPHFRSYLARPDLTPYDRMVGSLNYSAALVATEDYAEAENVLRPLREQTAREGHRLLLGNTCELLAQTQLHTGRFAEASVLIEESWAALKNAQPRYRLYLQKWQAVAALMQNPADEKAHEKLRRTRVEAIEVSDWETIRDCDFHESLLLQNKDMFLHLYFGTPHEAYRQLMQRRSGGRMEVPEFYEWGRSPGRRCIDVERGAIDGRPLVRKGLGRHRLLKALALDFYAPVTVAHLFAEIFEDEHYLPETSAPRVHELLRRFKADLRTQKAVLPVVALKRGYRIDLAQANCALLVRDARAVGGSLAGLIAGRFGSAEFRLRELADALNLPHTTLYREIKRLLSNGTLLQIGTGKATRYVIHHSRFRKAA